MRFLFLMITGLSFISCTTVANQSTATQSDNGEWLIPKNKVIDGGPGKDGIPALTDPAFVDLSSAGYINDEDLVIVFRSGETVRFYPHKILDWHEIINDDINGKSLAVSYCPLTGTAIGLKRTVMVNGQNKSTTFGVSGLLYNTNLILYDRQTDSYWSQMRNQCVAGQLKGALPENYTLLETNFKTARAFYPQAQVVSSNTGVYSASQYGRYPYGDYRTNNDALLFSVSNDDKRLPRKERVLGVAVGTASKAYRFSSFSEQNSMITDNVGGTDIVVLGNKSSGVMLAFASRWEGGTKLTFTAVNDASNPALFLKDNFGNIYDALGLAVSGPNKGSSLQQVHTYMSYWFAWGAFHPETDIY